MILKIFRMKEIKLYQSIPFLFSWKIKDYQNDVVYPIEGKTETIDGPTLFLISSLRERKLCRGPIISPLSLNYRKLVMSKFAE